MTSIWRLLNTGKHHAAMNMAIDETILRQQKSSPQPTLRFYDWSQSAFSFGYFQQISAEVDVEACASRNIEIVRRMTGGGIVIHGWDVTYTLIVPHGTDGIPQNLSDSYRLISDCLIKGLQQIGVPVHRQTEKLERENAGPNVCLTNPAQYDIMLHGKKIAGVSQRRNRAGVMYQGYIALDMPPPDVLALATKLPNFNQTLVEKSVAINIQRSTVIDRKQIECGVTTGFEETLGRRWTTDKLSRKEIESAKSLGETKYATAEWNFRR